MEETNNETDIENTTKDIRLYSAIAILISTFLGGPLVAGYMIGENFKSLHKPTAGRNSLIIGIVSTITMILLLWVLPDNIVDKISPSSIPTAYATMAFMIINQTQGKILKLHKKNGNAFFSVWRVFTISLLAALITSLGMLALIFGEMNTGVYAQYDKQLAVFEKNETIALSFYDHLDNKISYTLLQELEKIGIPNWKENIAIIEEVRNIEDLPSEITEHSKLLLDYSKLRLESFLLFKKIIAENTDEYNSQLDVLHQKIDAKMTELENFSSESWKKEIYGKK